MLSFRQLNIGWNADPNAPEPQVEEDGPDVVLSFYMNALAFKDFVRGERGLLRFPNCTRFRLGRTNDEGWYLGQCRFGNAAPQWGEFYEVSGNMSSVRDATDWHIVRVGTDSQRHFLFYFRDATFECRADDCVIERSKKNALAVRRKDIPTA